MFRSYTLAFFVICISASAAFGQFDLSWHTVDGGGQTFSIGGQFALGGTAGQSDAGPGSSGMSGGAFSLVGGFWSAGNSVQACNPCDTNCDGSVNLFDIEPFIDALLSQSGCSPCAADANADGSINLFDVEAFVQCVGT